MHHIISENLIAVALAIHIEQLAQYVIIIIIIFIITIALCVCCLHNHWQLTQLLVIISIFSEPITRTDTQACFTRAIYVVSNITF